jgi:hypothetical protein
MKRGNALLLLWLCLFLTQAALRADATITIINGDPANVGFNDPTPVDPVGGNSGTTLGQQRQIAFQAAADKWWATLTSEVPIRVLATWEALSCNANSAVLGAAGATEVFRKVPNAPRPDAWFSKAQANSFAGMDLDPTTVDIRARFNVNLGKSNCLAGSPFYLGLDNNAGLIKPDLVTILTHEFAHGLGFQTFTDATTGKQFSATPSIWDFFLFDSVTGLTWDQMTDDQRAASAVRSGSLVWNGSFVNTWAPVVLKPGVPGLSVTQPDSTVSHIQVGTASFGPALTADGVSGQVVHIIDTDPDIGLACDPLSGDNAAALAGNLALLDRGTCNFTVKVKNAQDAGAIGVIIADNTAGSPPNPLGGADDSIVIPAVRITLDDGKALKSALAGQTITATLAVDLSQLQGADSAGRVLMYAPNPYQGGSSVSHFDTSSVPSLLMGPYFNTDLTHEVRPPKDLTYRLFQDIGWK